MPDISQYKFELQEVAEILVRQAGVKEGLWQLNVEFTFGAATMGPSEKEAKPTAIAAVAALGISRADKPGPLTVDVSAMEKGK